MGDGDDYPLGTIAHVGNLEIGGAYTNQVAVSLPDGISGDFYIVVYTDFGDLEDERLFEGDNISASDAGFQVLLADYPDLKIENAAGQRQQRSRTCTAHISWKQRQPRYGLQPAVP